MDAEQPSQPLPGGIVFACPISSVIARCRFLLQDTKLISDATEAEKIIDVQELRRSAKDNTLKIQADKILERFNRRIILHDLAGPFRPDWIRIPSFNYTLPKSAAISTRDLIKNFFRALALGIRDLFPKDAPEFQFVFLCRLDEREEETRLSFIIPFQNLLGYIHDILDDPKGMKAELEGKKALDILHKYGILPGAYFPVVAVYRPILRYVEFNNQNQINSPQQFLSPHLCHTTSGFLNFLGVLEARHLEVQGSPGPPIFQFDNLHEAMNKGLDNWFRWLYCFLDTKVLFDPNRLYISSNDPERYDYFYSGEKQGL